MKFSRSCLRERERETKTAMVVTVLVVGAGIAGLRAAQKMCQLAPPSMVIFCLCVWYSLWWVLFLIVLCGLHIHLQEKQRICTLCVCVCVCVCVCCRVMRVPHVVVTQPRRRDPPAAHPHPHVGSCHDHWWSCPHTPWHLCRDGGQVSHSFTTGHTTCVLVLVCFFSCIRVRPV